MLLSRVKDGPSVNRLGSKALLLLSCQGGSVSAQHPFSLLCDKSHASQMALAFREPDLPSCGGAQHQPHLELVLSGASRPAHTGWSVDPVLIPTPPHPTPGPQLRAQPRAVSPDHQLQHLPQEGNPGFVQPQRGVRWKTHRFLCSQRSDRHATRTSIKSPGGKLRRCCFFLSEALISFKKELFKHQCGY